MKLSAPKQMTFLIAVIVAIVGLLLGLFNLAGLGSLGFWAVVIAFVILAAANLLEGV